MSVCDPGRLEIKKAILQRLDEFDRFRKHGRTTFNFQPFLDLKIRATLESELAFCISTANSSAKAGLFFQKSLENRKVTKLDEATLEVLLKGAGVRFYRQKAKYIRVAMDNFDIVLRALELESYDARRLLTEKIKGLGYKEASHFLRNVGRDDVAILDRHVLRWLCERGYIGDIRALTPRAYVTIERLLSKIADEKSVSLSALDLCIWAEKTGVVLK